MTIAFGKFQPKNTEIRRFWSQIQPFSLFHKILQSGQSEGADFKYDNSFLKCQLKNAQISIFSPKFKQFCFFFAKFLNQPNLRELISNMTKFFLKFIPKSTQIRYFLVQNLDIFIFSRKFVIREMITGADFKYDNVVFKFPSKYTQITSFSSQI